MALGGTSRARFTRNDLSSETHIAPPRTLPGFGDQRELELLVEAGFTPVEAIQIYSANGASWLGESDRIGTVAPGKLADLVLVQLSMPLSGASFRCNAAGRAA
jgi:hypothetical protein